MRSWTRTLFVILTLLTVLSLTLSACELIDNGNVNPDNRNGKDKDKEGKITICHKTGSAKNPYVEMSVADDAARDGHTAHEGDIIPAPEGGCPTE